MKTRVFLLCLLVFCTSTAWATEKQSHVQIRELARAYAAAQTQALPGKVTIKMRDIDPRTVLAKCAAPEAFLPGGSSLMGESIIGVRCNETPGWTVFVQCDIRVSVNMLVANRPLAQNAILTAQDFSLQKGEMTQPDILTDPAQAIGKTLKFSIGKGQILRTDMMRAPFAVLQSRMTEVRILSPGFSISATGQALNDASAGQSVQVRMTSGQIISGMATPDGRVDVRP